MSILSDVGLESFLRDAEYALNYVRRNGSSALNIARRYFEYFMPRELSLPFVRNAYTRDLRTPRCECSGSLSYLVLCFLWAQREFFLLGFRDASDILCPRMQYICLLMGCENSYTARKLVRGKSTRTRRRNGNTVGTPVRQDWHERNNIRGKREMSCNAISDYSQIDRARFIDYGTILSSSDLKLIEFFDDRRFSLGPTFKRLARTES